MTHPTDVQGEGEAGKDEVRVHVCRSRWMVADKRRRRCSTCKERTTQVGFFAEWYGWFVVCLRCGEEWEDGQRLERPFCPGWRKRNVASARESWARCQRLGVPRRFADVPKEELYA